MALLVAVTMPVARSACGDAVYGSAIGVVKVALREGNNYVGSPFDPYTASDPTLSGTLGTNQLPAAATEALATTATLWNEDTQALTNQYWLSSTADAWQRGGGTEPANDTVLDREKGVVITIASGQGSQTLYLAGRVPTQEMQQVVISNGYTLAASPFPVPVSLADSGLISSGFTGGTTLVLSDNLLFFTQDTGHFDTKVWYDSGTATWRNSDTTEATRMLQPGESFLIRRRGRAANITWTCALPYSP